jgi:choline dehydrogenase-like flavoprotein
MAEQVDVLIAGTGFGGSITAYRLAELYRAAGADAGGVLVLEKGPRRENTDFKQSMDITHLSDVYELIQGQGAQIVVARGVGGGSALYLAASLRAPTETFERRDRRPGDGDERRMWPGPISRASLNPYYRRAELGLRVNRPSWNQVSKSGGLWAANLRATGHTCDRVPLAISPKRCVNVKWCHTGCVFGAKNSLYTNYLPSAERLGVKIRPHAQVESVREVQNRPYRYSVTVSNIDPASRQPAGSYEIECKVLVLATGAMGNSPILMRSRSSLPQLSEHVGRHLGVNGDHIAAIEYDPKRVREVLGLPEYRDFHKGKPITTMTYDFWVGRRSNAFDGTRFTLQEIFLSSLTNFLYDDGRDPAGDPSWWGLQKKDAIANWANRIELLAMVEDTNDGAFFGAPPTGGGAVRPNAGPVAVGLFNYELSEQSRRVREQANAAMKRIGEHRGLGRFMKLTETEGSYASHPLGGCRMSESEDLGVTDHTGAVFGYEGLYCIDSSIIPTSLGVNPSLTIAAVSERCAELLAARGADFGLPAAPPGFRHGRPAEIVGERRTSSLEPGRQRRRRRRRPRRRRRRARGRR